MVFFRSRIECDMKAKRCLCQAVVVLFVFLVPAKAERKALFDQLFGWGASENRYASPPPAGKPSPVSGDYSFIDPNRMVPSRGLQPALAYYKAHRKSLRNPNYLTVVDFSQHITARRMFVIDMRSGRVQPFIVAHGSGSDPGNTGHASVFMNKRETHASSLGFYRTGGIYLGQFGYSMRLTGLSASNSLAAARTIVMHPWPAGSPTWGCLGVESGSAIYVINALKGGSLIYAFR